jgi:predicted DNA-binding protein (MmcQ/YjbR family)
MGRREWIEFCLSLGNCYEDYPFDEEWALIRHRENRRAFAFLYERNGKLWVNLKCRPEEGDFLRAHVSGFFPAYHMNKTHWVTAALDGSADPEEVKCRLRESFTLTEGGRKS